MDISQATVVAAGVSALAAAVTAIITAASMQKDRKNKESRQMLDQAVLSLERAYEALSAKALPDGPPISDRTAWLTAARLLQQYLLIKDLVISTPHKLVLEEHEEHWRHRFYLILQPLSGARGVGYYNERTPSGTAGRIEAMSAVVIHTFATWPEGKQDPLRRLRPDEIPSDAAFLKGSIGLRKYLSEHGFVAPVSKG